MTSRLDLKTSCLTLLMWILGGCIDLHEGYLHEVGINSDEIGNLKSAPEIRAIHFSPQQLKVYYPPTYEHTCRRSTKYAVHCSPYPYCCYQSHFLDFEDPASLVQNRFSQGIRTTLELDNVRSIPDAQPRSEDHPHRLQESFNEGLALTFETRVWRLLTHDRIDTVDQNMRRDVPKINLRYNIEYVVRATLIRNRDAKTLWRGVCGPGLSLQMDDSPVTSRLQITDYSQLNEARNLLVTKCSEQLLNKFLKRYEPHASTFQ